jgi:hypothetical protein
MHNRQGLSWRMFAECLMDWHLWPIYLIGLTWLRPNSPISAYLTLQLKTMGFSTLNTNLLTIPAYVLFIIQLLSWTWLSERINQRFLVDLMSQIWVLPILIALELIPAKVLVSITPRVVRICRPNTIEGKPLGQIHLEYPFS